jgi:hypothetical protein
MGTRCDEQCRHETTETRSVDRRERAVPYSVPTGAVVGASAARGDVKRGPGALFLRESRRNTATQQSSFIVDDAS